MILAQVVAAVVHPVEGLRVSRALGVVAIVADFLVGRQMHVLPVPVQVGLAFEGLGFTRRVEAGVPLGLTCRCRLCAGTIGRNQSASKAMSGSQ